MENMGFLRRCLVMLAVAFVVSSSAASSVSITVENKIINTTDERFVSFTIDASQLTDNQFDFSNSQLIYLASQLSPAILRCGGTQADYTYYEVGNESPCNLPSSDYHCLSMSHFNDLVSFASNVNADLVFGLSMGYPEYPTLATKTWNYTNTQQFLEYLHDTKGYTSDDIYGFELGNEVNQNEPFNEPHVQAQAFKTLKSLIDKIWTPSTTSTNNNNNNKKNGNVIGSVESVKATQGGFELFGCDPHSYTLRQSNKDGFNYISGFVNQACDVIDGLTYHCYVNQNTTQLLTADGLNEQYRESVRVSNIFNNETICESNSQQRENIKNNIWAGEIAEHNQGGIEDVTNTYYDGFWYLDALGTISNLGHSIFLRQTLALSNYGLLDNHYNPNCDYFTAVLFNQIMSKNVIGVTSDSENLRIYAHCGLSTSSTLMNHVQSGSNSVGMAYINLHESDTDIEFDTSVLGETVYLWILTPESSSDGLKSTTMKLNGNKLELDSDGKLPDLSGQQQTSGSKISVPAQSYGFFLFTSTTVDVCA